MIKINKIKFRQNLILQKKMINTQSAPVKWLPNELASCFCSFMISLQILIQNCWFQMANAVYYYFLSKLIELLDTVFFVLRKKQRQISFLHVYHHGMMPICAWIGVRYVAGGHATLLGWINAFVHIIMYTYYMLSAFGPHVQKYLWWKKYLTSLQLIQFSIILVHNLNLLFWRTDCQFPKFLAFLLTLNAVLFLYLFGSFYVQNYIKNKTNKKKISTQVANGDAHVKAN